MEGGMRNVQDEEVEGGRLRTLQDEEGEGDEERDGEGEGHEEGGEEGRAKAGAREREKWKEEGGRRTEEGGSGHERPSTKASSSSFSLSGASISSCEHSSLWSDSASTSASASPLSS